MFSTAIVVFREVLEIALILSVVIAATTGLDHRGKWIIGGLVAGLAGACLVALFAEYIAEAAEGMGQELFNAALLLTAATVIGWTALWMSKHARHLTKRLRHMSNAVIEGDVPFISLALVIALAILREGAEIVLFLYSMVASGQPVTDIISGGLLGLAGGAGLGIALYIGLVSISPRHIFGVTTWLLVFLCAGMSAAAAQFLASAGWFSSLATQLWDSSSLLSDAGIAGKILHTLFGYTARPLAIQLIFYVGTVGVLLIIMKLLNRTPYDKS